jgi:hypothetical protein
MSSGAEGGQKRVDKRTLAMPFIYAFCVNGTSFNQSCNPQTPVG